MANTTYDLITGRIIAELNSGRIPWKKPWIGCEAMNFFRRVSYRGINRILLPGGEYVTEKELKYIKGSKIKEGANPYYLAFYRMYERPDPNNPGLKEKVFFLRHYEVYALEDIEGAKSKIKEQENNSIEAAEELIRNFKNCPIIEHKDKNKAFYNASKDIINIPPMKHFESSEAYYATLFKLLVHSTGHESRMKRMKDIEDVKEYSREELMGLFGTSILCGIAGIDNTLENPKPEYLQGWIDVFSKDDRVAIQAACKSQSIVDYIMGV